MPDAQLGNVNMSLLLSAVVNVPKITLNTFQVRVKAFLVSKRKAWTSSTSTQLQERHVLYGE